LQEVFDCELPFGGCNVIFFGDLFQLSPVKAKTLATLRRKLTLLGNPMPLMGRILWLEMNRVINQII
jgi:hypothetical protein